MLPLLCAILGVMGYKRGYRPDWRNPYLLLYDIPTLPVAFAFAGMALQRLLHGDVARGGVYTAALLLAVLIAAGVQYASWPLSGHLTVATTVGCLEMTDCRHLLWWRILTLTPIVLLVWIRIFRPQSALMADRGNTLRGVLAGLLLGGLSACTLAYCCAGAVL